MRAIVALLISACLRAVAAGSPDSGPLQDRHTPRSAAVPSGSLLGRQAYYSQEPGSGSSVLVLPNAAALLPPLAAATAAARTPEECSALCRQTANCTAFQYCGLEVRTGSW